MPIGRRHEEEANEALPETPNIAGTSTCYFREPSQIPATTPMCLSTTTLPLLYSKNSLQMQPPKKISRPARKSLMLEWFGYLI